VKTPQQEDATWLVGDVGGTNARFGLVSPDGALLHWSTFAASDFAEIELPAFLGCPAALAAE